MNQRISGECLCGGVRYEVDGTHGIDLAPGIRIP